MKCPKCGKDDDKVIETRMSKDADSVRRRRLCLSCSYRFTTYETIIPADTIVIKKDGTRAEYKPEKILFGISQACWKRNIPEEIKDKMMSNITNRVAELQNNQGEISSQVIGEVVMEELKKVDEVAYVRFASVYRHFKDAEAFIDVIHDLPSQTTEQGNTP